MTAGLASVSEIVDVVIVVTAPTSAANKCVPGGARNIVPTISQYIFSCSSESCLRASSTCSVCSNKVRIACGLSRDALLTSPTLFLTHPCSAPVCAIVTSTVPPATSTIFLGLLGRLGSAAGTVEVVSRVLWVAGELRYQFRLAPHGERGLRLRRLLLVGSAPSSASVALVELSMIGWACFAAALPRINAVAVGAMSTSGARMLETDLPALISSPKVLVWSRTLLWRARTNACLCSSSEVEGSWSTIRVLRCTGSIQRDSSALQNYVNLLY